MEHALFCWITVTILILFAIPLLWSPIADKIRKYGTKMFVHLVSSSNFVTNLVQSILPIKSSAHQVLLKVLEQESRKISIFRAFLITILGSLFAFCRISTPMVYLMTLITMLTSIFPRKTSYRQKIRKTILRHKEKEYVNVSFEKIRSLKLTHFNSFDSHSYFSIFSRCKIVSRISCT